MALTQGGVVNGEVRFNNRKVTSDDFGKLGAFVQQDDILVETCTPRESFVFAARLRTSTPEDMIPGKV